MRRNFSHLPYFYGAAEQFMNGTEDVDKLSDCKLSDHVRLQILRHLACSTDRDRDRPLVGSMSPRSTPLRPRQSDRKLSDW